MKQNNHLVKYNEALSNEINWGDSLLGRLINSAIRKGKVGYNLTKVDSLVEAFKRELDGLIASGLQRDTKNKYNVLLMKSYFSEIQNICESDLSDEEKMDKLVGKHDDLWDSRDPDGGMWKNWVDSGYLRHIYEDLDFNRSDEDIKKIGMDKKELLDRISDLIDNLRRATGPSQSASTQQQGYGHFSTNFGNVTNTLANLVTAGYEYHSSDYRINESVYRFEDFLLEAEVATQVVKGATAAPKTKEVKKPENKQLGTQSATQSVVKSATQSAIQSDVKKKSDGLGATPQERVNKVKALSARLKGKKVDSENPFSDKDVKNYLKCLLSLDEVDVDYMFSKNPNAKIKIDDKEYNIITGMEKLLSDPALDQWKKQFKIGGIRFRDSNTQVFKSTFLKPEQKIAELQKRLALRKKGLKKYPNSDKLKKSKVEIEKYLTQLGVKSKKNESVVNFSYFKIFEALGDKPILDIFNEFKESFPESVREDLFTVTQKEVDEAIKLKGPESQKLIIDLSKHPDPIVKIVRLFQRAHDLYFSYVIPSGRTNGKVSNKTFQEYILLGRDSSSNATPETPGYGPWANKKIFDKWRDGVLEVLEDQKYRKILSNVKFIVPGSEDTFNQPVSAKENIVLMFKDFDKIFEELRDDEDTNKEPVVTKKSHGQLLFDFINDMLDKDTAADFDKRRKELLKKYFGQFGFDEKEVKQTKKTKTYSPKPKADDLDEESLFWNALSSGENFKASNSGNKYEGEIYAIPIEQTGGKSVIFLHALQKRTIPRKNEWYLVKIVFNKQNRLIERLKEYESKFSGYNCTKDFSDGPSDNSVYYGFIKKLPRNGEEFKIYCSKITRGSYDNPTELSFKCMERRSNSNETVTVSNLHSVDSNKKDEVVYTKLEKKLLTEENLHYDNLKLTKSGKKLDAALEEIIPTP